MHLVIPALPVKQSVHYNLQIYCVLTLKIILFEFIKHFVDVNIIDKIFKLLMMCKLQVFCNKNMPLSDLIMK